MDLNSQGEDALDMLKKRIKKGFFRITKHVKSYCGVNWELEDLPPMLIVCCRNENHTSESSGFGEHVVIVIGVDLICVIDGLFCFQVTLSLS